MLEYSELETPNKIKLVFGHLYSEMKLQGSVLRGEFCAVFKHRAMNLHVVVQAKLSSLDAVDWSASRIARCHQKKR